MKSIPSDKRYLVYLASNAQGLELERYEVDRQLARHGMVSVGFAYRDDAMPYDWGLVRSQIESCDLFLLLLGDEYGPMDPTGISYIHREFVHARSLGKPTLAFIKNTPMDAHKKTSLRDDLHRLSGFHQVITQQSPFKLWHLREELITHVRASLASPMLNIGSGWQRVKSPTKSSESAPVSGVNVEINHVFSAEEIERQQRESLSLSMTAKVYQAGNLKLEDVNISTRYEQLFGNLSTLLRQGVSEDRLRNQLEASVAPTIRAQLLQRHSKAHAVDDVRMNRTQFQTILKRWERQGLIRRDGNVPRERWYLKVPQSA